MYIRKTTNAKGQQYYHLVEAYREDGKVKQRVLMSLGSVDNNRIFQTVEALSRFKNKLSAIGLAKKQAIDVKKTYLLGPLLILQRAMERWGVSTCLEWITQQHPKLSYNLPKAIFTMMASRFIRPVSKLCLYDNWMDRFYPEMMEEIALHQLYRSLDILAFHKEAIERFLYAHNRNLFERVVDIVLYDLTTLRFESTRTDTDRLRRFGYSKEKRNDCTQVVLGLLTDEEGIPLCFEVHPGNTFEGHTLQGIVEKMRKKFCVRRFVFVADRGLFSTDNLSYLSQDGGEFIVGLRLGKVGASLAEPYNLERYRWVNAQLAIQETTFEGNRCILTWSAPRAQRDRQAREEVLARLRAKLSDSRASIKKLITHEGYRQYVVVEGGKPMLNEKAIEEASKRDGFYGIITNVKDMTAQAIVFHYKQLWRIEDAFGEIKGTLSVRPIFHWTDSRIIGHMVLCFLCYFCEAMLTRQLRSADEQLASKTVKKKIIHKRPLTVSMGMQSLLDVVAVPVEMNRKRIWVRTDIDENALKLFRALQMKIPPKILKTELC